MDRLEAMSLLVATAEAGSFSAAGRQTGVPLPTISRKIAELEAHLNTRLLVRSTRKLSLTDAGAAYLAASKRILEQVGDAEAEAAGEYSVPRGELIVTAPLAFGRLHVLPVITDFLAEYPEIDVRLVLSDRNVSLADDHVDMAVRIGALPDSSLVATRVGTVRRIVCASPAYLAAHGTPKTPADLAGLDGIGFSGLAGPAAWTFATRQRSPAQPRRRLEVNSAEAAVDAAVAGAGVTRLLSYQAARAVAKGKLRIVLQDFEPAPLPVHLLHAGQGLLPLKMRRFLDVAVPWLRAALAGD